jgi:hypothetical protein
MASGHGAAPGAPQRRSRIEVLTSFYKHPLEIAADSILASLFIYCVFGGTAEA